MEIGELITLYRKQAGLTIDELSEKANVPKGTLNKIIGGITKAPTLETMRSIAYALGKKLADFDNEPDIPILYSPAEDQLIKKYRTLDRHGKNAVDCILDIEIDRIVSAQRIEKENAERKSAFQNHQEDTSEEIAIYITTLYHQPVSAGNGEPADDDKSELIRLVKMPPRGTSFVTPVFGDSMEPTYCDGDLVFVRAQPDIYNGQIGIFFMDGQMWLKELGDGVLLSHNPKYPPRPMTDDVRCQGLVLGVCDENYLYR